MISEFGNQFKAGSFNGMEDIYEYNEGTKTTDNNTPLKYFPSYVFCKNAPQWGSVEYWLNEYKLYMNNLQIYFVDLSQDQIPTQIL